MSKTIGRLMCAASLAAFAAAALAGPSTQFTLTGAVSAPRTFTLADLQALPATTQTVSYTAAGVPQTRTYVGTNLYGLIADAGIVNPPGNNAVLNKYVLATGSDGYKVAFSLGELNPSFGNRPDLVAYQQVVGGVAQPLGSDGFARITAPGDVRGGRYVSNLVNLDVRTSGSTIAGTGAGATSSFSVGGAVATSRSFDLAALQALPSLTQTIGGVEYTGVSLWGLLNGAAGGIVTTPGVNNDLLGKIVVATGSDGYKSVFSVGELSPNFGNQPDFVAYFAGGAPLVGNGFARIVVPNDLRRGRWVSNLASIEVISASPVPEPATGALAFAGLGLLALRRRR